MFSIHKLLLLQSVDDKDYDLPIFRILGPFLASLCIASDIHHMKNDLTYRQVMMGGLLSWKGIPQFAIQKLLDQTGFPSCCKSQHDGAVLLRP